jgi:uncharacterized membrane-anchored protein
MTSLEELQSEINQLKARNKKVEADKAWETSWTRKLLVLALTYLVMILVFWSTGIGNMFVNAIVPSVGFFLSTLTIPAVKRIWIKKRQ